MYVSRSLRIRESTLIPADGNNTLTKTPLEPTGYATKYTWYQSIKPTIVGTVYVVINNFGQTKTVTSSNTEVLASHSGLVQNGSLQLLTRTDVNAAGTVTYPILLHGNSSTILTYPTPYSNVDPYIYWYGVFPTILDGIDCCTVQGTSSPTPSHYPFITPTATADEADPSGWLYAVSEDFTLVNGSTSVASFFAPASIISVTENCPHQMCTARSSVAAATAASEVGALLKTSTVHVTGSFSGSNSVEVDPVSTSRKSPTKDHSPTESTPEQTSGPHSTTAAHIHHRPTRTLTSTEPFSFSSNILFATPESSSSTIEAPPIVFAGSTVTPTVSGKYVIGSQTLLPGGPGITVSGIPYSLASGATELIAGSVTAALTQSPGGLGSYIWSGIGGSPTTPSVSGSSVPSVPPASPTPSESASGSATPVIATGGAGDTKVDWLRPLIPLTTMMIYLMSR